MLLMPIHGGGTAPSPAAAQLLEVMEELSENHWAAGWLTDLEFSLWQLAHGDPSGIGTPWRTSAFDGAELRRLSDACGGWWAWDDAIHDARFVPIGEWRARVEARAGS